jgi:asparagine synthase (glutamine-hydrolysing)
VRAPAAVTTTSIEAPFLHLVRRPGGFDLSGVPAFFTGYELPAGGGIFCEWRWDGAQLHARVDRYGCFPLFYFERPGEIGVSTSLAALLAHGAPREVDEPAVAAFVRLGFYLGEDTPFAAIRAMPPQGRISWDGERLHVTGSLVVPPSIDVPREEAIDRFNELFASAIRRRPPAGRTVLPLSGGRDSRHILLALIEGGHPPDACATVTALPPRASETDVAAALSRAAGVRHVVVEQSGARVPLERRKNELTHFCSDEHAQFLALAEYVRGNADTAYDGLGGDMLTGQSSSITPGMVALIEGGRFEEAAARAFEGYGKHGIERALADMLRPSVYVRLNRERALERVTREMARHHRAANPTLAFFFWNRTRRELALPPYSLMPGTRVYSPYLDHDLFDFLAGLPASLIIDHQLHTAAIRRAYPRFRDVPYNEGERSTAPDRLTRRAALDLAAYLLRTRAAVRVPFAMPRLAAAAVTAQPGRLWFLPLAVYVTQLLSEQWQ